LSQAKCEWEKKEDGSEDQDAMVPGIAEETDKTHSDTLIMQVCMQTWDHNTRESKLQSRIGPRYYSAELEFVTEPERRKNASTVTE
jgi:hypothetical protein